MKKTVFIIITLLVSAISIYAQTWEFVGLDSMVIKQLYVSGDTIWAGTAHRIGNLDKSGLYKSTDSGNNWTQLDDTLGNGDLYQLELDKQNTDKLWIIKGYNGGIFYKSTDGGENWDYAQNNTQNTIQWFGISPFNKNEIYMIDATYAAGGIFNSLFKSTDNGNTWENITAFPSSSHGSRLAFAFDLIDSMNLYVTVDTQFDQYFYKSTNKGANWFFVSIPPSWGAVYTDYFIPNRIYLFPQPYISNDAGLSWFLADSGLSDTSYYLSYYQDRETTKLLYSLRRDGLYSSKNDTLFWSLEEGSEDLPIYYGPTGFYSDRDMNNIFIESERRDLFLGTAEGIYKTTVITNVKGTNQNELDFLLSQNYPNPFNPETSMQYTISSREFVTLKVCDVLGRTVATLVNEEKPAGSYEVRYDATGLPSGIYFYRLQAGSFIETKKMILIK